MQLLYINFFKLSCALSNSHHALSLLRVNDYSGFAQLGIQAEWVAE